MLSSQDPIPHEQTHCIISEGENTSDRIAIDSQEALSPTIHSLPREVLVLIFQWLPSLDLLRHVPSVCRHWYETCMSPLLRRRLILNEATPPDTIRQALNTRPMLQVLRCTALKHADPVLQQALALCPSLRCLDIGFCSFSRDGLNALVATLTTTLVHLNVEGVNLIDDTFIISLVSKCPQLEALNLSHCNCMSDCAMQSIANELPFLKRLNVDGVASLTDTTILSLSKSKCIQSGRLTALWLDGYEMSGAAVANLVHRLVAMEHVSLIIDQSSPHVSSLHSLSISFCTQLTPQSIEPIKHLSNLTSLTLRKAPQIPSDTWIDLFTPVPGLSGSGLQGLRKLDLSESHGVTDAVVIKLCQCCGAELRSLILNWCWDLTDVALEAIVENCSLLRYLSLIGVHLLVGDALRSTPHRQPELLILNLTQCNYMRDSVLFDLARAMPDMYIFDYFGERVGGQLEDICYHDLKHTLEKIPFCTD